MPIKLPLPNPDRWNNLNTTTSMFLLLAVMTAFTCGVSLGMLLLCGMGEAGAITPEAVSILDKWLFFLTSLWGIEGGRFWVKRKTHQPGGSADLPGPGGRASVAVPTEGGAP